jgi:hypothetical protein
MVDYLIKIYLIVLQSYLFRHFIKITSTFVRVHTMKEYEGAEAQLHSFLTLALEGGDMYISSPCLFSPLD